MSYCRAVNPVQSDASVPAMREQGSKEKDIRGEEGSEAELFAFEGCPLSALKKGRRGAILKKTRNYCWNSKMLWKIT